MRCNTPKIRIPIKVPFAPAYSHDLKVRCSPSHRTKGDQLRKKPMRKMSSDRVSTFLRKAVVPASSNRGITKAKAFPTANKKNGKTRSVGVQPCHGAWARGAYKFDQLPGLFTSIIKATVAPRKTSR